MSKLASRLPAKTTERFLLIRSGHYWTVKKGIDTHGPYLSRRDAFLDAVDAAYAASKLGDSTEVVDLSTRRGETLLWRSEHDNYPPNPRV